MWISEKNFSSVKKPLKGRAVEAVEKMSECRITA
jgi:hypothetical protein